LLLIDCMSRQVVAAPHRCWYLALSYVWGNQKARTVKVDEKLTCLPQTIEDAITVTSKLGFRYLWVDMYCIRQDNQSHVGDQIRHMDLVYRQAQATIIAAAGDNPAFGLPGVSCARQTRQVHVTMNGLTVANFAHNPWELVDSSVWNSRAWTFQESLFSPCRIFFTTEQVIFNC
ncbi:HET-domain-containing protein, partial [Stipitochalara longipes BDJ]